MADAAPESMTWNEADAARRDLVGWPHPARRQMAAERLIETSGLAPREVVAWFGKDDPITAEGAMALATALDQVGQPAAGNLVIRKAWRTLPFDLTMQETMLARFHDALTPDDYAAREDMLLYGAQGSGGAGPLAAAAARPAGARSGAYGGAPRRPIGLRHDRCPPARRADAVRGWSTSASSLFAITATFEARWRFFPTCRRRCPTRRLPSVCGSTARWSSVRCRPATQQRRIRSRRGLGWRPAPTRLKPSSTRAGSRSRGSRTRAWRMVTSKRSPTPAHLRSLRAAPCTGAGGRRKPRATRLRRRSSTARRRSTTRPSTASWPPPRAARSTSC